MADKNPNSSQHDSNGKSDVRGVFSTQEVRRVGTGTTTRKTVQKTFWFIEQNGKEIDSVALAEFLEDRRTGGTSRMWMVIGGPLGVSQTLLLRADFVLSLSRMTFPHDLARLMVMEQLYRAFTILKGEAYHK